MQWNKMKSRIFELWYDVWKIIKIEMLMVCKQDEDGEIGGGGWHNPPSFCTKIDPNVVEGYDDETWTVGEFVNKYDDEKSWIPWYETHWRSFESRNILVLLSEIIVCRLDGKSIFSRDVQLLNAFWLVFVRELSGSKITPERCEHK